MSKATHQEGATADDMYVRDDGQLGVRLAPPLIEQLRARHAELLKARKEHNENVRRAQEYLVDAEKKDYGLAAVMGELETWIAQLEPPAESQ